MLIKVQIQSSKDQQTCNGHQPWSNVNHSLSNNNTITIIPATTTPSPSYQQQPQHHPPAAVDQVFTTNVTSRLSEHGRNTYIIVLYEILIFWRWILQPNWQLILGYLKKMFALLIAKLYVRFLLQFAKIISIVCRTIIWNQYKLIF